MRFRVGDRVEFRMDDARETMRGGDGRKGTLVKLQSRPYGEWWVRLDDGTMKLWAQRHFVKVA